MLDSDGDTVQSYDYQGTVVDDEVGFYSQSLFPGVMYPYTTFKLQFPEITHEAAERNAEELLAQEKKEKEKANKKRLKKKKQRDRRRQQKTEASKDEIKNSTNDPTANSDDETSVASQVGSIDLELTERDFSESDREEDLNLESTFVQQVQKKINKPKPEKNERANGRFQEKASKRCQEVVATDIATSKQPVIDNTNVDQSIEKSIELANIGNNMAQNKRFLEAVMYYTQAITLNPSEVRFLGNRSYSYERCGKYAEALRDAEEALSLHPDFIKGQFRKGKALKGLLKYAEAIEAFQKVLESDINQTEAAEEIVQCKMHAHTTRPNVIGNPLVTPLLPAPGLVSETGIKLWPQPSAYLRATTVPKTNTLTNTNVYPVWVGNIKNTITEDVLRTKFEPYGTIHSMRVLHTKRCAFINFTEKQDALSAFRMLQGLTIDGTTFILQLRPGQPTPFI
ncbi:tetratricopeptide repeat protein 31-like [Pelobates fuscus]|uniref:tetratricopeptide repeat protein 31-like n=1 Tax=Pelobates fuscus TaxID=191477 RepID=UPI002FE4A197